MYQYCTTNHIKKSLLCRKVGYERPTMQQIWIPFLDLALLHRSIPFCASYLTNTGPRRHIHPACHKALSKGNLCNCPPTTRCRGSYFGHSCRMVGEEWIVLDCNSINSTIVGMLPSTLRGSTLLLLPIPASGSWPQSLAVGEGGAELEIPLAFLHLGLEFHHCEQVPGAG